MSTPDFAAEKKTGDVYQLSTDEFYSRHVDSASSKRSQYLKSHQKIGFEEFVSSLSGMIDTKNAYFKEHQRRFFETISAIDFLIRDMNVTDVPKILEFGGSHLTARIIDMFFKDDCDLFSADLGYSDVLEGIVRDQFEINLERDDLHGCILSNHTFDLILFCEVIEHLRQNPARLFRFFASNLRPGGYLYMTTPNFYRHQNIVSFAARMPMQPIVPETMKFEDLHGFHVREYCANEIFQYASAAGFSVDSFYFSNCWDDAMTPIPDHELSNMVFIFRKNL